MAHCLARWRSPCWLVMLVLCTGCLVGEDHPFEQPNVPSVFLEDPSGTTPLGQIVVVDGTEVVLRAQLTDQNAHQPWRSRWRHVTLPPPDYSEDASMWNLAAEGVFEEAGTPEDFQLTISVPRLPIVRNSPNEPGQCVRIDVLVSREFLPQAIGEPPKPADRGDLAQATWWLWVVQPEMQLIDPKTCPRAQP